MTEKAMIMKYRQGRHTQTQNHVLVEITGVDTKAKASKYIGKKLVIKTSTGKEIHGKITHTHGTSGVLRARFSKGVPSIALGKTVKLE